MTFKVPVNHKGTFEAPYDALMKVCGHEPEEKREALLLDGACPMCMRMTIVGLLQICEALRAEVKGKHNSWQAALRLLERVRAGYTTEKDHPAMDALLADVEDFML